MPKKPRRYMEKFELGEISFCRTPAQEPALAAIMKSSDADFETWMKSASIEELAALEKSGDLVTMMTSSEEGHQHGISISSYEDEVYFLVHYAGSEEGESHDHMIVMGPDGSFTVSENRGHTHTVDSEAIRMTLLERVAKGDLNLPEDGPLSILLKGKEKERVTVKENDMTDEERIAKLEADLKKSNAIATMNDAQKSHYNGLDDTAKSAFIEKSVEDRQAEVDNVTKAREVADPVVYTAPDGTDFRKSDDPRLVQMAKDRDEDRKNLAKERARNEHARLEKAAESEYANLPGSVETRIALIKSAEGIEDEKQRDEALAALKAQSTRLGKSLETIGVAGQHDLTKAADATSADAELNRLAKELAQKEGIDFYDAYERVSDSNPDLLTKAVG